MYPQFSPLAVTEEDLNAVLDVATVTDEGNIRQIDIDTDVLDIQNLKHSLPVYTAGKSIEISRHGLLQTNQLVRRFTL